MADIAQRTQRWNFLDVSDEGATTPVWKRMGTGFTQLDENPNAQTENTQYINMESENIDTTSYAPNYAVNADLIYADEAIKRIYDIANQRKTYGGAVVKMLTVDVFDKRSDGSYGAKVENLAVAITGINGSKSGAGKMVMTGNLNGQGDGAYGTYSGDSEGDGTGTFTPNAPETPETP